MINLFKGKVAKMLCSFVIGASMLTLQVPAAHAFVKCYSTICSDDGTLCITFQVSC
jgi:hypothetical protein